MCVRDSVCYSNCERVRVTDAGVRVAHAHVATSTPARRQRVKTTCARGAALQPAQACVKRGHALTMPTGDPQLHHFYRLLINHIRDLDLAHAQHLQQYCIQQANSLDQSLLDSDALS